MQSIILFLFFVVSNVLLQPMLHVDSPRVSTALQILRQCNSESYAEIVLNNRMVLTDRDSRDAGARHYIFGVIVINHPVVNGSMLYLLVVLSHEGRHGYQSMRGQNFVKDRVWLEWDAEQAAKRTIALCYKYTEQL